MSLPLLFDITEKFFTENKVEDDHGWKHAITVAQNAACALCFCTPEDGMVPMQLVLAAALLHDADDRKIFKTVDYANARQLLKEAGYTDIQIGLIIEMISYVSASANGNISVTPEWKLYPRFADRIEAIGQIGINRCYIYTVKQGRPIALADTPIVTNELELSQIDTKSRFEKYATFGNGTSGSMIDHYYDKLIAICDLGTRNYWFKRIAVERRAVMVDWLFRINAARQHLWPLNDSIEMNDSNMNALLSVAKVTIDA